MPGPPPDPPELPSALDFDALKRLRDSMPRVLSADESFSVRVKMPPIPCKACGADLRGKPAVYRYGELLSLGPDEAVSRIWLYRPACAP